jgi:hypothetical protein
MSASRAIPKSLTFAAGRPEAGRRMFVSESPCKFTAKSARQGNRLASIQYRSNVGPEIFNLAAASKALLPCRRRRSRISFLRNAPRA